MMYYTKGMTQSLRSINHVLKTKQLIIDLHDKKLISAYHRFLKKESIFGGYLFPGAIKLSAFEGIKTIAPSFYEHKKQHFAMNSSVLKKRLSEDYFDKALLKLKEKMRTIFDLANFLIKIIIINQLSSYTNGTTNETIGLAIFDFKDNYEDHDFIELILHQMTHMLLFIDDRVTKHMVSVEAEKTMIETGLRYKLGGSKFPAYIAFHSYIVGLEVLFFRNEMTGFNYIGNYHGETMRIIRICKKFRESLFDNLNLFTERGKSFLYDSSVLLHKILIKLGQHGVLDEYESSR